MKRIPTTIALLLPMLITAAAVSANESFPLGERYRVGRYLPVRADAAASVSGAVPVFIKSNDPIVPLLIVSSLASPGRSFRPLSDDTCLIGGTTTGPDLAAELFPGQTIEFAMLNLADPLPGSAMAWGMLDAVFLDAAAAARVTENQLAALLVSGTAVAVRANERPVGDAPWQQHGPWWIARIDVPRVGNLIQPDRYASLPRPVPGWPSNVRRTLILLLAAFSLAAIAATLWRWRHAWVASVALSIVAVGGITFWWSRQPTIVKTDNAERFPAYIDRWTQYTAIADGEFRHPIDDPAAVVWPAFFSRHHAADVDLRLECASDGNPFAFTGRMRRGQSLVFLTRSLADHPPRSQQ